LILILILILILNPDLSRHNPGHFPDPGQIGISIPISSSQPNRESGFWATSPATYKCTGICPSERDSEDLMPHCRHWQFETRTSTAIHECLMLRMNAP
jgi:hypothetical protein